MSSKIFIITFLVSAVLLPSVEFFSFFPSFRMEIFVILVWFFFNAAVNKQIRIFKFDIISNLLIFLLFFSIISIANSYLFLNVDFNYRDFMIVPMILQYLLVLSFGRSIFHPRLIKFFTYSVVGVILISALVGIAQRMNVLNVNNVITPIFTDNYYVLRGLKNGSSWGRAIGTIGDPRHFGYVITIGIAAVAPFLISPRRRFYVLIILITLLIANVFTGSRTSIISSLIVLIFFYFFAAKSTKNFSLAFVLSISIASGVIFFIFDNLSSTMTERLIYADTEFFSTARSLGARIRDTTLPFKMAIEKPLIFLTGHGPSKSIFRGSMHSDIGWFILRFGMLGCLIYLSILYRLYNRVKHYFKVLNDIDYTYFFIFIKLFLINWFIFILAESIFKLDQIMSLNMFITGVVFSPYFNQLANTNFTNLNDVNSNSR